MINREMLFVNKEIFQSLLEDDRRDVQKILKTQGILLSDEGEEILPAASADEEDTASPRQRRRQRRRRRDRDDRHRGSKQDNSLMGEE